MDTHNEELISAYFDGEVTAEQRRDAERLLAESDEARRLLDELGALRANLKSLPEYRLERDFAAETVERAAAAQADSGDTPAHAIIAPVPSPPRDVPADSPYAGMRRSLLWSALAVAAAVLIMLYAGPREKDTVARKEPGTSMTPEVTQDATGKGTGQETQISARPATGKELKTRTNLAQDKSHELAPAAPAREPFSQPGPADAPVPPQTDSAEAMGRLQAATQSTTDESRESTAPLAESGAKKKSHEPARKMRTDSANRVGLAKLQAAAGRDGVAVFRCASDASLSTVRGYLAGSPKPAMAAVRRDRDDRTAAAEEAEVADKDDLLGDELKRTAKSGAAQQYVYAVEGTSEQIAATFQQLGSQPDVAQLVSIDPRLAATLYTTVADDDADRAKSRAADGPSSDDSRLLDMITQAATDGAGPLGGGVSEAQQGFARKLMQRDAELQQAAGGGAPGKESGDGGAGFAAGEPAQDATGAPDEPGEPVVGKPEPPEGLVQAPGAQPRPSAVRAEAAADKKAPVKDEEASGDAATDDGATGTADDAAPAEGAPDAVANLRGAGQGGQREQTAEEAKRDGLEKVARQREDRVYRVLLVFEVDAATFAKKAAASPRLPVSDPPAADAASEIKSRD